MKHWLQWLLARVGFVMMRTDTLVELQGKIRRAEPSERDLQFLESMPEASRVRLFALLSHSRAQLRQDLLALVVSDFKTRGYFVEFGAADGCALSNTYLLEKQFQWTGILAEPAIRWHPKIRSNRSVILDTRCVWRSSGERILFKETRVAEYSTIEAFADRDLHAKQRQGGRSYEVETIALLDLLKVYDAPSFIDYLSIDTEGSELDILSAFDFNRYRFGLLSVEHNFTESRAKIADLLSANGYQRILESVSAVDDWYVHRDTAANIFREFSWAGENAAGVSPDSAPRDNGAAWRRRPRKSVVRLRRCAHAGRCAAVGAGDRRLGS